MSAVTRLDVTDGTATVGHVIVRTPTRVEAYDRCGLAVGVFAELSKAVSAVVSAARQAT